ncbi:NEDD8-activating enzyme E1 regulatory subunit-like isoform X2 [Zophobas morio]|uniref:NEDD8-activating enzyme E1 regulatory subunit-like isoform X2 n=1 Tax=Zophobas morio TaxID=2755281 RepID=UPI0030838BAB
MDGLTEKRYERQIQLWGVQGQTSLRNSKVCLINADATGTEALKNLILAGVGSFTIVDDTTVKEVDYGNNFFIAEGKLDHSRAECTYELLQELNPEVTGNFISEGVLTILKTEPTFFDKFSLVIGANLTERILQYVGRDLWDKNIPLILVFAYGMIAYVRIVHALHTVVQGHVDNLPHDFQCDAPFPALKKLITTTDLDSLDSTQLRDVPYLLIILFYLKKWLELHSGRPPETRIEKDEFKKLIQEGGKKFSEGNEVNFEEAFSFAFYAWRRSEIPSNVLEVFRHPCCDSLTKKSDTFWFLARAVRDFTFYDNNGRLPLRGVLPDMTAGTANYSQLLLLYQQEAVKHASMVSARVHNLLLRCGLPEDYIDDEEIKTICENSATLKCFEGTSLQHEEARLDDFNVQPAEVFSWYFCLKAARFFQRRYGHSPGTGTSNYLGDLLTLKSCLAEVLNEMKSNRKIEDEYLIELCRFGASEIHSVAACASGIAAQEGIKVLTRQFYPLNNALIVDTVTGQAVSFRV